MITYIRGILEGMEEDKVIVDVGGVGYGIYMAGTAMGRLPALGKEVKIHTHLHVKEDLMQVLLILQFVLQVPSHKVPLSSFEHHTVSA